MAPGFALVIFAFALAAIAPVVFLVLVGCSCHAAFRPQALRSMLVGFIGGGVVVGGFVGLSALVGKFQPASQPELWLVLFAAGFSCGALGFFAFRMWRGYGAWGHIHA